MLRQLLILLCFFSATNVIAQGGIKPVKTTKNSADPQIDYKQIGAQLPPMRLILYTDTAYKKSVNKDQIKKDNLAKSEARLKREEKQKKEREKFDAKGFLTSEDLDNGANLFVMMFNPTCSHCQEATIMMGQNGMLFKKTKVALIANPMMQPYLGDFIVFSHADQYPFMYLGIDSADVVNKLFLYHPLPQINIYDHDRKLIKIFTGDMVIDSLKQYIE